MSTPVIPTKFDATYTTSDGSMAMRLSHAGTTFIIEEDTAYYDAPVAPEIEGVFALKVDWEGDHMAWYSAAAFSPSSEQRVVLDALCDAFNSHEDDLQSAALWHEVDRYGLGACIVRNDDRMPLRVQSVKHDESVDLCRGWYLIVDFTGFDPAAGAREWVGQVNGYAWVVGTIATEDVDPDEFDLDCMRASDCTDSCWGVVFDADESGFNMPTPAEVINRFHFGTGAEPVPEPTTGVLFDLALGVLFASPLVVAAVLFSLWCA